MEANGDLGDCDMDEVMDVDSPDIIPTSLNKSLHLHLSPYAGAPLSDFSNPPTPQTDLMGPTLADIQTMQSKGVIPKHDHSTFSSKFVEPSSSDSEDEPAPEDFSIDTATEKQLEAEILRNAKLGNTERVKELLERDNKLVCATDDDLYTPLHRASYNGHLDTIRLLLEYKADPNAPTLDGWTPLHSACCWGKLEAARLLLAGGSRVNARSYQNTTPLHVAANRQDNQHVLELLLTTPGINPSIRNDSGDTAGDIARRSSHFGYMFEAFCPSLNWNHLNQHQQSSNAATIDS